MEKKKIVGDFNPDREGHVSHKWMVTKATKREDFTGVNIDGKEMKFGKKNAFMVSDPVIAQSIREEVGMDATVTRFRVPDPVSDRGHTYFFGQMPRMPWHRYDEHGNRIREEEQ